MQKQRKRLKKGWDVLRYLVLEVLFALACYFYLRYIWRTYSFPNPYENHLFKVVVFGGLFIWLFFGPILNKLVMFVYGCLFNAYLIGQFCYHEAFNSYFRLQTALDLVKEVLGVKESAAEFLAPREIQNFLGFVALILVFLILALIFERKTFRFWYRMPISLLALLLIFPIQNEIDAYNQKVLATKDQEDIFQMNHSDYYIYDIIPTSNQFVDTFGLLPFFYRDVEIILTKDVNTEETRQEITSFLAERKAQSTNDLTGLFKGKNVIFVQAESYNRASLDEELTPTIYKMFNEGIRVQNFNTPALPGSTSDTEFMANVSLIPNSEGHAVCYAFPNNTYPTTLAKLFKEAGYHTSAYHNNFGDYYNRNVIYETYGYDEFIDCNKLGVKDYSSDLEVEQIMKYIIAEQADPYMVFWITFSGHQPYTLDSVGVSPEDVAKIKEKYPTLDDSFVSYIAKNMDLDHSLQDMMKVLEDANKLDDVVFVFFGDHEAKNIDFWGGSDFYKQTGIAPEDYYRYTDLYIYNSAMEEPMVYEKVATTLDFIPTFANLWGFSYDAQTVLGHDIFDPTYDGLFFSEWEYWRTDHYQYNFMEDTFLFEDSYDEQEARKEMRYAEKQKEISKQILKLDYFKK